MFPIDIEPVEYSFTQNLYCLLMYCLILGSFYRSNVSAYWRWREHREDKTLFLIILFFIYSLTNFVDHDYWGYYEGVKWGPLDERSHFESPYVWIINAFERNYLIFRILVWGLALTVFCIGAKILRLSVYHSVFALAICFFVTFTYGRVSLAMALVFTGYIILYKYWGRNLNGVLAGGIIFISAFYFHRSIVFAMAMAIVMPFVPIKKRTLWFAVMLIPILFIIAKSGFLYILETGAGLNERTASAVSGYSETVREKANFMGCIRDIINYSRFYVPAYIGIKALYIDGKEKMVSRVFINLFKIALGLIFVGTCFFFLDLDNSIFAYRILFMSMIPLVYCMVKFYDQGVMSLKYYRIFIWCGIIATVYVLLYGVYKQF